MRHGGRSRRGADFIPVPRKRGLPILVIGGGKQPNLVQTLPGFAGGGPRKLPDVPTGDDVTLFWTVMGQELGKRVEFVNGAQNIEDVNLDDYSIIAVASARPGCPAGGLTEQEHDAFSARATDVATFIYSGRGVIGFISPWRTRNYRTYEVAFPPSHPNFPNVLITRTTYGNYAWLSEVAPGLTQRNHYGEDIEGVRPHVGPTCPLGTYCLPGVPGSTLLTATTGYAIGGTFEDIPYEVDPNVPNDLGHPELAVEIQYAPTVGSVIPEIIFLVVRVNLGNARYSVSPDLLSNNNGIVSTTLIFTENTSFLCTGPRMYGCQSDGACGSLRLLYQRRTDGIDMRFASALARVPSAGTQGLSLGLPFGPQLDYTGLMPGPNNDVLLLFAADNAIGGISETFTFRFHSYIGWTHTPRDVRPTTLGANMGLTDTGMDLTFQLWEQTYPTFPATLEPFIAAEPDFFRYVDQAAGLAGFGTFPGGGSVVLIGQPQEEAIFENDQVVTGSRRSRGDFDQYVLIMQRLVDEVESHGVRVERAPQDARSWSALEP